MNPATAIVAVLGSLILAGNIAVLYKLHGKTGEAIDRLRDEMDEVVQNRARVKMQIGRLGSESHNNSLAVEELFKLYTQTSKHILRLTTTVNDMTEEAP